MDNNKLPDDPTVRQVEEQTRSRSWWVSGIFVGIIVVVMVFVGISLFAQN
ncbi:MAG: hypothetical protein H6525_06485 [Actinobacteria bacterium]|nr:hypothetical protein [Actinomycetota bacterium]MCB9412478.1 hypothetical protein [Actinomycetota bacterium]